MLKVIIKRTRVLRDKFKQLSFKKKVILVVVLLSLAGLIAYQYRRATRPPNYELEVATLDLITEVVSETGNVTTAGSIPVYSTTTGMVEEVFVINGGYVEKNTSLFKVTSTATQQEKNAALSTYLTAKAAWETAKATQFSLQAAMFTEWDEFKELAESDDYEESDGKPRYDQRGLPEFHIPEKEWLAAEALYKKQQIAINQTAANLSAAWQAYQATQDSEVKAVLNGEVRNLGVAKGDLVAVPTALTLASTPPVLVLFNSDVQTMIKVDIGETDVIKVKENQQVKIEFDAISDKIFPGHIDRVDTLAAPTEGVVKYSIYIVLDEKIDAIKGGMTADVDIVVAIKENVLTVPAQAVRPHEGGRAVRIVGKKGEIEYVPVTTGAKGDGKVEILSGIDEGTQVIMSLKNEQVERTSSGLF